MSADDAANCTFEPNAGSQNLHMKKILETFPELQRDDYDKEKSLREYVDKFGDKFMHSNPEIYKKGILRSAQSFFNAGEIKDAWRKLKEGFNVESLKRYFDPNYAKKLEIKKKKQEERKKLIKEGKIKEDIKDNLEEPEEQRKMREEAFEKPKLLPVLEEAFALVQQLEAIEKNKAKEKNKFFGIIKKKVMTHKSEIKKKEEEAKKKIEEKRAKKAEEIKKQEEDRKAQEEKQQKLLEKKKEAERKRLEDFKAKNKQEMGLDKSKKKRPASTYKKPMNKDLKKL